jgi:hypothetical protein
VLVLAHYGIFKNQETNGAVKSLTDNNLEAIVFIANFVFAARHNVDVLVNNTQKQQC